MTIDIQQLAIAVITCNRLPSLERLLKHLQTLETPSVPDLEISVVVVENGEPAGAEALVRRFDSPERRFFYDHEPRPGISYARNRAMKLAVEQGDYFAFIDDDEWPAEDWLDALLRTASEMEAPVVCGNVESVLQEGAPAWVIKGGFFRHRNRLPTGSVVKNVSTANVLIRSSLILDTGLEFDPAFAITGGSDTLFFRQLSREAGIDVIYCAEALVFEEVPRDRMQLKWFMRRSLRTGANLWRTEAALGAPAIYRLRWIAKGAGHVAIGLLKLVAGLVTGHVTRVRGLRQAAKGTGMLIGACGSSVNEYHERHQMEVPANVIPRTAKAR